MQVNELIKIIKDEKEKAGKELDERKNNISKKYELAKFDFVVIENINDKEDTLRCIIEDLEELQKRIVKRNRGDK